MEVKMQYVYGLDEIDTIVGELIKRADTVQVFTFTGPLGAGKTTLVKKFLLACGVHEVVTSPTFTYLNIYSNAQKKEFYHFDLYRLETLDAFFEQGFDEYLYAAHSLTLVEWPHVIEPLLKNNVCHIVIDYHRDADKRILTIECK